MSERDRGPERWLHLTGRSPRTECCDFSCTSCVLTKWPKRREQGLGFVSPVVLSSSTLINDSWGQGQGQGRHSVGPEPRSHIPLWGQTHGHFRSSKVEGGCPSWSYRASPLASGISPVMGMLQAKGAARERARRTQCAGAAPGNCAPELGHRPCGSCALCARVSS